MKTVKVECDSCKRDITCTTNSHQSRIVVSCEEMPRQSGIGVVTDMDMGCGLEQALHFCTMACFFRWKESKICQVAIKMNGIYKRILELIKLKDNYQDPDPCDPRERSLDCWEETAEGKELEALLKKVGQ